jgi:hypothetical protein
MEVFNNISTTISVNDYNGVTPPQAFVGVPGNGLSWQQDFTAETVSVATQCKPIVVDCNLSPANITSGAGSSFQCKRYPAFVGIVNGPAGSFLKVYFTDSSGRSNDTESVSNPFYVGFNGITSRASASDETLITSHDPNIIPQEFGGLTYVLFCSVTVYSLKYSVFNGSITSFTTSPTNGSIATALMVADRGLPTDTSIWQLQAAANLGALIANTSQQMADIFAAEHSRVLLRTVSGALQPSPVEEIVQRTIITRCDENCRDVFIQLCGRSVTLCYLWNIFDSHCSYCSTR